MRRPLNPKNKSVSYLIAEIVLRWTFFVLTRLGLYWLLGRVMVWGITRMNPDLAGSPPHEGHIRVLSFTRGTMKHDIAQLESRGGLEVLRFPWPLFDAFARAVLPRHLRSQIHFFVNNFPRDLRAKRRMTRAVLGILPYLRRKLGVNALITANVNYYYDQAWAEACQESHFPFIVLYKESVRTKAFDQHLKCRFSILNERYAGHSIAVYNHMARQAFIDSGVARPEQVFVTGAPRTDRLYEVLRQAEQEPPARDLVVLFAFNKDHLSQIWADTLRVFSETASRFDGRLRFVVKVKYKAASKRERVKDGVRRLIAEDCRSLVEVVDDADFLVETLLSQAVVVTGFNSTTLVEAMASSVPVIVPCWAEASLEQPEKLLLHDEGSAAYDLALEAEAYREELIHYLTGDPFEPAQVARRMAARGQIVEQHLYRIDGHSSQRTMEAIRSTIGDVARQQATVTKAPDRSGGVES